MILGFIHGGPALHALSAPSEIAPVILTGSETPAITATSIASSNWRAFTDEEEKRLARAWDELQLKEETQRKEQQSACTYPEVLGEATAKPQDSDVADSGSYYVIGTKLAHSRPLNLLLVNRYH